MPFFLLKLSFISLLAFAFSAFGQDHSSNMVNYTINCTYNPETRIIEGEVQILWIKPLEPKVNELQLHLYLNAFSGPNSTFMKEYGEFPQSIADEPGYCKIQQIEVNRIDVTKSMQFIQPDDGNKHDSTVISVPVRYPQKSKVKQGSIKAIGCTFRNPGGISCKIKFQSRLPALLERVGVYEDFIMAAQWFPQLGVFEKDGWKCHQFHANSEFYANFGSYNVTLTLPKDYVVGASGEMTERKLLPDGQQQLKFTARRVHDFAWCADATMQEQVRTQFSWSQTYRRTRIRLLYQPEHEGAIAERIMVAVQRGLNYFEACYGPYPYPQLTVIDAPIFNAVMEYPTLFLTGNFDGYKNPPAPAEPYPDKNLFLERLTLHELGHQWFYGVCANNEAEEAWLDEGLTEYITAKAFEHSYGKIMQLDENGIPLPVRDFRKDRYIANPDVLPSTSKSWEFPTFGDYYIASYVKPKLLFYTLDNMLGGTMEVIVSTFYKRFAFRHPKADDFFNVVEEVAGKEVRNFVAQYLKSQETYDPGVNNNSGTIHLIGNLPKGFPIEHRYNLPKHITFPKGKALNLVSYPYNQRTKPRTLERALPSRPFGQVKQKQPSPPTGYYFFLDPDSLIEFDLNHDNNLLRFPLSGEND